MRATPASLTLLLTSALWLAGCGGRGGLLPPTVEGPDGQPAEVVELVGRTPDGKLVRLSDLRGKVVLVNYFATWCEPCLEEAPRLEGLLRGDDPLRGFEVLGVSVDLSGEALVPPWAELLRISYPLILADKGSLQGNTPFGPLPAIPASFLVDAKGRYVQSFLGQVPIRYLRRRVEALIGDAQ
ncbi:MAG: TlpA family protein disulfide reductase [Myxococcales bacterium]|nr:TlpA family protein disulfide reductase [Myxococcales bacterium]